MRNRIARRAFSVMIALAAFFIATACAKPTMASQFGKKGVTFGVAVQAADVLDPKCVAVVKENFNLIVPENTMKWRNLRPTKGFWNWSDMDAMVKFAAANGIAMKGHTFVWHQQNAPYVEGLKTRDEAIALLQEQITTVMTRYKGKIREYDVANEVLNEDGTMRDTVWLRTIGDDYLDIAFKAARAADPDAKLYLNDYNNEYEGSAKGDGFYELAKALKQRNVPIDGVGFQLHVMGTAPLNADNLRSNVRRFAALGLLASFTEIDVRIPVPVTPEMEATQTEVYRQLLDIALTEPNARSFIVWGYTDKRSWIPAAFPGFGSAHLFDRAEKSKPAYEALKEMIIKAPKPASPAKS
jgi:endo-1,4-beta-xylanase